MNLASCSQTCSRDRKYNDVKLAVVSLSDLYRVIKYYFRECVSTDEKPASYSYIQYYLHPRSVSRKILP